MELSENIQMNLAELKSIVFGKKQVDIEPTVQHKIQESFRFLENFIHDKVIYGVNTGFGPMAQYRIGEKDRKQLQYNLIRSHATGVGQPLSLEMVRAAVLARFNTLSLGYSGVHPSVLDLMKTMLNRSIYPVIFSHGGVGASGDLVQLAHLALAMIGEGEVWYKGERHPTEIVFREEKIEPLKIYIREGLSIMNGTSVMAGIGLVNIYYAEKLMRLSCVASSMINELVCSYDDHFSVELNAAKLHKGQRYIAKQMRNFLQDSSLIRSRKEYLYKAAKEEIFKEKVQEYYSLRCVPQILGPVQEMIWSAEQTIEKEINSASDNPIVDLASKQVYHGGNFHGDYIAFEMDKLKLGITKLCMLAERQLNYLLNSKINELLPPFVNSGKLGFNFGMQGAQFTATSTTAENQTLSTSMYIHSIPNNNDNQDVVSMGANAALLCNQVIENSFEVLSVHFMTIVQAIEVRGCLEQINPNSKKIFDSIRKIFPATQQDVVLYPYIKEVNDFLKSNNF
ncbi:aromatic amino acid ammonia-lyase [Weeksella virosa]|uniref:HAL/PAL/TAL family ammonia-lyase n=2 Tax=Weeksella TaxID=1013 RepID=UPI002555D58D|nr:aromatic amino acid ammonia-lyase [Weeksella virosa]MDK7674798.1 aromatic amino acid ammonia-lyase [Weeksella virosa]